MSDDAPDSTELGQRPSLSDSFEPITPAHERALDAVEDNITAFDNGGEYTPLSVRGPFRTGKTALQYHGFEYAWEHGVPAAYVEASTLLDEYDSQDGNPAFDDWVLERLREEVAAMADREFDSVRWVPSGTESSADRREWVENVVPEGIDTTRVVLFVDEVEQEYTRFLSATEVDDDNPLRKLLDRSELLPVLSMGQLSAFEFIGDADLGRMEPVSIPPITVDHIEELLADRGADPTLERLGFWLTRGRAARVHQLVTEAGKQSLAPSDHGRVADWLSGYAHQRSTEFQPVRQIWEDPAIDDPEAAAGALAFDSDGYDEWVVDSENCHPASEVVDVIEAVLLETEPFVGADPDASHVREGRRILRRSVRWVVRAIAAPADAAGSDGNDRAVPSTWLSGQRDDREESKALLSIVQDFLLAFEANRDARDLAFDALENAKGSFKNRYDAKAPTLTAIEGNAWTVRPTVLERAFPPLATDPSRLTDRETSTLKAEMDRGLEVTVAEPATVYACPTQTAFEGQLRRLAPDPTHPTVVLVDDAVDIDDGLAAVPRTQPLADHDALDVVTVPTTRVWEFVAQLFGRLGESGDPYRATEARVTELIEAAANREDRTTIETLYDHLTERVAAEAAAATVEAHRRQFEVNGASLWAEETVAGPSWVNPGAEWSRGRHAVPTLLALGAEPDWDEPHGELLNRIEEGLESDTIDTKGGFAHKELLSHVKSAGGYGKAAADARHVCRSDDDSGPAPVVTRLQGVLESAVAASEYDRDAVLEGLFEAEGRIGADDPQTEQAEQLVDSFDPVVSEKNTADVLWALVTASLARADESYVVDCLASVEADLTDLVRALDTRLQDVNAAESVLAPEGVPTGGAAIEAELEELTQSVRDRAETAADRSDGARTAYGTGVTLDAGHIEAYRENVAAVRDGVRDAKEAAAESADARPTAYALAVLASRYEHVVRDAVDELERATPTDGDLSGVENLRTEVDHLTDETAEPALSELSDDRADAVESFADAVLDFQEIADARITVGDPAGDGMDAIRDLNRTANERCRQVRQLAAELREFSECRSRVTAERRNVRRDLRSLAVLLSRPDEPIEPDPTADERSAHTDDTRDTSTTAEEATDD